MNICEGMRLCLEVMSKEEIELENADLMVRLRSLNKPDPSQTSSSQSSMN
jgi:hypothetical protein